MTDPYRQHPNPYGQQPGRYGPNPPGGPQNPYGQGQPNSPGPQPNPQRHHGQQPDPYGGPDQYAHQPDRRAQQDPEATQVLPRGGQYGPGQPNQYTRQYEPSQLARGGPGDQYGQYQGSYGQPPGSSQGGARPPGPPRKPGPPVVLFTVLGVLVIVAVVITAVMLAGSDSSTPAAQITATPSASSPQPTQSETASREAPTSAPARPPATTSSASKTFEAGQCATLTPQPGNRATLNEALCGGGNSDVIIALVQDGDCVKDYITFNADVGKVYCLALDAEEGTCFRFDQLAKRASNCAAGTHRVAKIFEKITDGGRCDEVQGVDRRYAYPQPARTVCLVPAP